jgi:hypothetical protein
MRPASLLTFTVACAVAAADFRTLRSTGKLHELVPRAGLQHAGLRHSLALQGSLLKRSALFVRGGKAQVPFGSKNHSHCMCRIIQRSCTFKRTATSFVLQVHTRL